MERRKITDLEPDQFNANDGTERGLRLLDDSLASVGAGRSLLLDKKGRIIGGNKTAERAMDRGFEDVIVIHTQGDQLVAVMRDDLDLYEDDRGRLMAYYDNRVAEVDLRWNPGRLEEDRELVEASKLWSPVEVNIETSHAEGEGFFDAAQLPDAPDAGEAIKKSFLIYLTFESEDDFYEAMRILSLGERTDRREGSTFALLKSDDLLSQWREIFNGA